MKTTKATILLADDEKAIHTLVGSLLETEGHHVEIVSDGVQAINAAQAKNFDVALLDIKMPKVDGIEVLRFIKETVPSTEVIMLTAVNDLKIAVECMNNGAFYYIPKPFTSDEVLNTINRALERKHLLRENTLMKSELRRIGGVSEIVGTSSRVQELLEIAKKVAVTESTVLIQGPSGTGKELIANFIYKNSTRAEKPFVAVNCASIPDSLIESELFGHEKGAFTDAKAQKQGLVEIANNGTLFLDEVGDVSPIIQPKLLRFIQTGEFRRVGGNVPLKSDVRIISATNKDLIEESKQGRFREDLLYRLNVITIQLPTLRERREDIPFIVEHFLKNKLKMKIKKTVNPDAMEMLKNYDWPGNVRELENVLERASILSKGEVIKAQDLALPAIGASDYKNGGESLIGKPITMKEIEKLHITGVLKATGWNKNQAAKMLGISLKTLYTKIAQFNLSED
jgi:DNA-binding NtrC family response regulator